MNKEGPYRDQAARLRKKIDRNWETDEMTTEKESLPPRSRLHQEKRQKSKWKIKYPVIRLLALIFILLPIAIFTINYSLNKDKPAGTERASSNEKGYESVGFEDKDEDKGTTIEERTEVPEKEDSIVDDPKKEVEQPVQTPKTPVEENSVDKEETAPSEGEQNQQDKEKQAVEKNGVIYHTVKPKENIFRIAMKYQTDINTIKKANNLNSDEIRVGQVLVIPKK